MLYADMQRNTKLVFFIIEKRKSFQWGFCVITLRTTKLIDHYYCFVWLRLLICQHSKDYFVSIQSAMRSKGIQMLIRQPTTYRNILHDLFIDDVQCVQVCGMANIILIKVPDFLIEYLYKNMNYLLRINMGHIITQI